MLVLPVTAVILWLVHAGLGTVGHRAYRNTRWILFGGLAAAAAVCISLAARASKAVPADWKDDSLAGVFEDMLALESLLVLLFLGALEVIHVAVSTTVRAARTRAMHQRPATGSIL